MHGYRARFKIKLWVGEANSGSMFFHAWL